MRRFLTGCRIVVGVLFIFSGLVKANDPLGLSYKMQEFFEVWQLHFLNDFTLAFSIIMIVFEIVAGVAVLLGWRMKLFSWLLLLLIVFFTFLTGYALFSGKIRECGCFGDCIPLQAYQSFIKDLLLLALIVIIFLLRDRIRPVFVSRNAAVILLFTAVFSFALQWYVLEHLPVVDCLPYKAGNNIPEKMRPPHGSAPDSTVILFTYRKNGKEYSFTAEDFPADFDSGYEFVKREDKLVRAGNAVAPIRDFILQTASGNDTTSALLQEPGIKVFLFVKDEYTDGPWNAVMETLIERAQVKNIPAFLVTNLELEQNRRGLFPQLQVLRSDGTAIKTAARHNPTLILTNRGTIVKKWSATDLDRALQYLEHIRRQ